MLRYTVNDITSNGKQLEEIKQYKLKIFLSRLRNRHVRMLFSINKFSDSQNVYLPRTLVY